MLACEHQFARIEARIVYVSCNALHKDYLVEHSQLTRKYYNSRALEADKRVARYLQISKITCVRKEVQKFGIAKIQKPHIFTVIQ